MTKSQIVNTIDAYLKQDGQNVIKISNDADVKLAKPEKKDKYLFSYADVVRYFKDIDNMLTEAENQNLYGGVIELRRKYEFSSVLANINNNRIPFIYDEKQIEIVHQQTNQEDMNNTTETLHTMPIQPMQGMQMPQPGMYAPPYGMGYTPIENEKLLSLKVREERYNDLNDKYNDLKSEYKDLKDRYRTLKREKEELKILNDIAEKKHELDLQEQLLKKKSVLENEGLQSLLALAIEKGAPLMQKPAVPEVPAGLGAVQNVSQVKKNVIEAIAQLPDNVAMEVQKFLQHLIAKNSKNASHNQVFEEAQVVDYTN